MGIRTFIALTCMLCIGACSGGKSPSSNYAPTIEGSFTEIRAGEAMDFTPQAYDRNGDILSFSINGKPSWAEFDSLSGRLYGTPPEDSSGSVYDIEILVTDGKLSGSLSLELVVLEPIFFVSLKIDSLDQYRDLDVELTSCFISQGDNECAENVEVLTIQENGVFSFQNGIAAGSSFSLVIDRDAGRQDCTLPSSEGLMSFQDQVFNITCEPDVSASLFSLDRVHNVRLSMSLNEWNAFVLDITRSSYEKDAFEGPGGEKTSQVYRQIDFAYLGENGEVLHSLKSVGFKMKGSTSRQFPEFYSEDATGQRLIKPRRFSFSLKFDEKFDEDESVYSCIDAAGTPSVISQAPCNERVSQDIGDVPENDDREFMGLEKLVFRFNRDDPSYQRELLAHDILNRIGVPAARAAHANVILRITGDQFFNGDVLPQDFRLGVFQMLEPIDKPFLKRFFGKNSFLFKNGYGAYLNEPIDSLSTCTRYEESSVFVDRDFCQIGVEKTDPDSREEWLGSERYLNPSIVNADINKSEHFSQFKPYKPRYDLKSKKSKIADARERLIDFIDVLQTLSDAGSLEEYFDVRGFIRAQAAEIVLGAADHYTKVGNNYYLYLNPRTEKWTYIPTDFDIVFINDLGYGPTIYRELASIVALPSEGLVDWASERLFPVADPILWNLVFSNSDNVRILYDDIKEILDSYVDWAVLGPILQERNRLAKTYIERTDAANPEGCRNIYNENAIESAGSEHFCHDGDITIEQFVNVRRKVLYDELERRGL